MSATNPAGVAETPTPIEVTTNRAEAILADALDGAWPYEETTDALGVLADYLEEGEHQRGADIRALSAAPYRRPPEDRFAPGDVACGDWWYMVGGRELRRGTSPSASPYRFCWCVDGRGPQAALAARSLSPPAGSDTAADLDGIRALYELTRLRLAAALLGRAVVASGPGRLRLAEAGATSAPTPPRRKASTRILAGLIASLGIDGDQARWRFRSMNGGVGAVSRLWPSPHNAASLLYRLHQQNVWAEPDIETHRDFPLYLAWHAAETTAGRDEAGRSRG